MDNGEVIQVGNIVDDTSIGFKNPQRGRIYSIEGLAPCLNCCGGGGLEPKIVENMDKTICLNSKVNGKQPSLQDRVYDVEGCSTAITTSFLPSIAEPKVINPLKGKSDNGWHFEQQVYNAEGIARAVKAGGGSGNIPKVIEPMIIQKFGDRGTSQYSVRDIAHTIPANAMSDRGQMVVEPISVAMRGRKPDNPSNGNYKQRIETNMSGVSNTITSVQKDSMVGEPNYRIRKLTPRECFRLQDVDDKDIDILMNAGISNSQLYKMAGNSIVVSCLYHLFRKLFVEKEIEDKPIQQTLF